MICASNTEIEEYDLFYQEDTSGVETFQNIRDFEWIPTQTSNLNFGISASQYFVKIKIKGDLKEELYLSIERPIWDSLSIYYEDNIGTIYRSNFGFYQTDEDDNNLNHPVISFNSKDLKNGEIYLKGSNRYPVIFPISISKEQSFFRRVLFSNLFHAMLIGGLLIMAIYNLFLWLMIREDTYLIYVLNILATCVIQASLNGYFSYFGLITPAWDFYSVRWFIVINLILSCLFTLSFIPDLRKHSFYSKAIYSCIGIALLALILDVIGSHYASIKLLMLVSLITAVFFIVIGYVFWLKKKKKVAMFFSIAWTLYLIALIIYILKSNDSLPHNWFTHNFVHLSKFFETALLSFALGFRYNELKKEKENLQLKLNNELEFLVEQKTESLNKALTEKSILLNEVHHRVKNNLQIITSLLSIQRRRYPANVKELILSIQNRIGAMSLVHEQLYSDQMFSAVNAKNYLSKLINSLNKSIGSEEKKIEFELEVDDSVVIPIDIVIPLGLVVNEIINNSIKHAFEEVDNPIIFIELLESKFSLILRIRDSGRVDSGENTGKEERSKLGLRMIHDMARQLNAQIELEKEKGYKYTFTIPLESK